MMIVRYIILMLILAMVLCFPVPASTVISDFECHGKNSTMMAYSYLKEPRLQESGFTKGFKTGSFNYLVNGSFDFKNHYKYYDGSVDAQHNEPESDHNASVKQELTIDFRGDKGILLYCWGSGPLQRNLISPYRL